MANSKNLLLALKRSKALYVDVVNLIRDLDYVLTSEDMTAEEFDLVRELLTKLDTIETTLKGKKDAQRT